MQGIGACTPNAGLRDEGIGARMETGRYSKAGLMWGREVSVGNGGEMEENAGLRGAGDWCKDGRWQVLQSLG